MKKDAAVHEGTGVSMGWRCVLRLNFCFQAITYGERFFSRR